MEEKDLKLSIPQKMLAALAPVLFIISNIFFFGPFTIYHGNINEFGISFPSILKGFLLPAVILFSVVTCLALVLPKGLHKRYISLVFVFGILIWLQGNIFVWDYGLLGKGDIDWTKDVWRGWIDSSIWVVILALAIIFYKHLYKVTRSASILFVSLQTLLLTFNSVQHPEIWRDRIDFSLPQKEIFEFSSKQNVIHIILDSFGSEVFQKIVAEDTAYYNNVFDGFTLFKETAGIFPTTIMSMPALLGGPVYKNDVAIPNFVDSVYKGNILPNVLYDNGYDVDLVAPLGLGWYAGSRYTNWYYAPVPYGLAKVDYEQSNSAFMIHLAMFRYAPHFLKEYFYGKKMYLPLLDLRDVQSYEAQRHFSQKAFLQDLINNMSVTRDKPLYKFIHLTTTHWPIVLNKDCGFAGDVLPYTWENIMIQAKCSLEHFIEFLNKLKSLGIYDSSFIILNADHGYWKVSGSLNQFGIPNLDKQLERDFLSKEDCAEKISASSPFLAIKRPQSRGALKVSSALTDLTDIPATVSSVLNLSEKFDGNSVFQIDTNKVRERRFYYYYELNGEDDSFFDQIDEYVITGSLFDRASWHLVSPHLSPGKSYATQKLVFGTEETSRFLRFGWSFNETDPNEKGLSFNWAIGKSAFIFLTLPKTRVRMTVNVRSPFYDQQQMVTVKVDDKKVGTWKNSKQWVWEKHSITIEPDENRHAVSTIEFDFSPHLEPTKTDARQIALLFESISLEELSK